MFESSGITVKVSKNSFSCYCRSFVLMFVPQRTCVFDDISVPAPMLAARLVFDMLEASPATLGTFEYTGAPAFKSLPASKNPLDLTKLEARPGVFRTLKENC